MSKRKSLVRETRPIRLALLGMAALALVITLLMHGKNIALFNPKGLIAGEQLNLLLFTIALLLVVATPTVGVLYYTAWKYRESNDKATYDPHVRHGKWLAVTSWGIPAVFMLVL